MHSEPIVRTGVRDWLKVGRIQRKRSFEQMGQRAQIADGGAAHFRA